MDDLPINKVQISGSTLTSILHRFSSSPGDIHGLLFGHVSLSATTPLSDDDSSPASSTLTATITHSLSLPSHFPLPPPDPTALGWFSGRRKTPLRPSLSDSSAAPLRPSPSVFLLLTTPLHDPPVHTHEYRAFHYRPHTASFVPLTLHVINIGPSFRSHYDSFTPTSPFPHLPGPTAMLQDEKPGLKDQKELDLCAQGFEVHRLGNLMGSDASNYTAELEHLYESMLVKLDTLAGLVEKTSAQVLEQENHNMKLRYKVAGLD